MYTGKVSKAARAAVYASLVTSVGVIGLGVRAAQADSLNVGGVSNEMLATNVAGNVQGFASGNPAQSITLTNAFGDQARVTGNASATYAGFSANVAGTPQATTLTGLGIVTSNTAGTQTISLESATGNASLTGNISANSASIGSGGLSVTGLSSTGGILNTGNIQTSTLTVNSNETVGGTLAITGLTTANGITNTGALRQNGVATFANTAVAGQGSSTINGGLMSLASGANPAQTITLNANGGPILTVNGGTAATTTTIDAGRITAGTSVTTRDLTATGQTTVSSFTVTGNANGNAPSTVSMGGNVVHDVAPGVAGTDAVNVNQFNNGINAANRRIDKAQEGVALALAISQPVFLPGQSFAFRAGWGNFESENAIGFSGAGVIGRDWFGYGTSVALDGGIGFGVDRNTVGGKAGVTIGFGGMGPSLK